MIPKTAFIRAPKIRKEEYGLVLIIVMWITLGLVSMTLLFANTMMLEYRAADNYHAEQEADQAIEGAYRYLLDFLTNLEEKGVMPDTTDYEAENVPVGNASFWLLGRNPNDDKKTQFTFSLVDEAGKININTAPLEVLELLPNMTAEFAAAIIDWRDTDEEMTENGAESDLYLLNSPRYNCKNAPFETAGELRLVKGGEWNILFGEDANRNGFLDPNEDDGLTNPPEDNRNGTLEPGILDNVTVYSREPNKTTDGTARINVASTDQSELQTLLSDKLGSSRAQEIQNSLNSSQVKSVLEFYVSSKMTVDEFGQIADSISDATDDFIQGRVNVNTASAEVLECIPGIGKDFASRLVDYRKGKNADDIKTVAWVTNVLDETSSTQAGPYITTKSYQFTADVAATGHNGKGFRRTQFVFDLSSGTPVVVFRQDLSYLGWPLGTIVRDSLLTNAGKRGRL